MHEVALQDDAAVALVNLVRRLKANDNSGPSAGKPSLAFDFDAWDLGSQFQGQAPAEAWLVTNSLPLGEAGMVVAMGDTGKGMLLLELGLRVASGTFNLGWPPIFGGQVGTFGDAVIISAEDSAPAIHRRLRKLDPDGSRQRGLLHKLRVVPLPDAGGAFPLIIQKGHEVVLTAVFHELRAELVRLRPRLIILDPLTPFCHADMINDPAPS